MKVLNIIVEILTSPFTILFRTKAVKNSNKQVNMLLVFFISLLVTAALVFIYYYERLLP